MEEIKKKYETKRSSQKTGKGKSPNVRQLFVHIISLVR